MDFAQYKIDTYASGVADLPDYPSDEGYTAAQLKAAFDARSNNEIKSRHNALVDAVAALSKHTEEAENPHSVTAEQLGLGNVDNTSDADKPISRKTQLALDEIAEQLVNIDTALDSILVIQKELIGGEGA